ncbi:MAG: hypothetical protein CMJ25_13205 [Phycisphaerae bacterium]|nr:hypothetical protein [Phycisphaerae bacterium]
MTTYNNAGNIRAGQDYAGETDEYYYDSTNQPYVIFDSPEMGLRALFVDLRSKLNEFDGDIAQMITKYAPPSDNNPTDNYIQFIKDRVGSDKATIDDLPKIVSGVIDFENTPEIASQYNKPELLDTAFKLSAVSMPKQTRLHQAYELANVQKPTQDLTQLSNQELVDVAQSKIDEFKAPEPDPVALSTVSPDSDSRDQRAARLTSAAIDREQVDFEVPSTSLPDDDVEEVVQPLAKEPEPTPLSTVAPSTTARDDRVAALVEASRDPVVSAVTPEPTKEELDSVKIRRPEGKLKREPDSIDMLKAPTTIDPFSHNIRFYGEATLKEDPTLGESFAASIGYQYDPVIEHINNKIKYGNIVDPNYNPLTDMEGYELYQNDLIVAQNAEHMKDLKRGLDDNLARRDVLSNTGFFTHFFVGLGDPVNLVALPFGGPSLGVLRSGVRVGAGVAALQTGQEALRAPFDPLNTGTESAVNIGSAFVAGNLLGGAIAVPASRRAKAYEATQKAAGDQQLSLQPRLDRSRPEPTTERPFSQVADEEVQAVVDSKPAIIRLNNEIADEAEIKLNNERSNLSEKEIADLEATIKQAREKAAVEKSDYDLLKQEQINRMEGGERTAKDLSMPKNWFTDSWAFKFITTPMKRVIQNPNAPMAAKEIILGIAGDSGILLNLHKRGLSLGPSVYQKAAMRDGEWVSVYDDLRKLFGDEYGVGKQTIIDYDVGGAAQRIGELTKGQPKTKTFVEWMTDVNIKRMKGEAASSKAEATAMSRIDEFYKQWETRLNESGIIGTPEFYRKSLNNLEQQRLKLEETVSKLKNAPMTELSMRRLRLNEARLSRVKDQIDDANFHIENMSKAGVMPANEDVFNPRFWKQEYIRQNRDKLHVILSKWYTENPYIYKMKVDPNTKKPTGWERVELDTSAAAVSKRVDDTIDEILGIKDPTDVNAQYFGHGRSKHFKHRGIDIPNKLVSDFIETNPISIMKAYTTKVAPQYEFMNKFGKSIDDVLDDAEDAMLAEGKMSGNEINATLRDIRHLNERVQGSVIRDPDALNYKTAIILKDLAMLNYLGSAGFSTLPDFAKIMMEHEMGTVWKSLFGVMSDARVRKTSEEGRIAGEIIDILKGDAHMRFTEQMSNNPLNDGFMSKVRTGFFMLNGVAPMTTIMKKMDAIARGHTLIDYSLKLTYGGKTVNGVKIPEATDMEIAYLARYNIGQQEAAAIAKAPWEKTEAGLILPNTKAWEDAIELPETTATINYVGMNEGKFNGNRYVPAFFNKESNTITIDKESIIKSFDDKPWTSPKVDGVKALPEDSFKTADDWFNFVLTHEIMHTNFKQKKNESTSAYENRINQLALSEIKKRKRINKDTVENFRTAMNSGILNTVLMGTPADKPIAVDGVFYIPMHVARKVGMTEDPKFKGYARIENGLLGMPFQFMSYSFAAANKITASLAQGQIKNRAVALTASMGLGYMGMELKYSDWQMEQMSWPDVIARSFDASGQTALWSDLFYTSMGISQALGGPDLGGGIISPKFKQDQSLVDAFTAVGGAGPSYAVDVGMGVKEFLDGNYGQGASDLVRRLPAAQLWFLKDETNSMARAFAGGRY